MKKALKFITYFVTVKLANWVSMGSGEPNKLDALAGKLHEPGFDELL